MLEDVLVKIENFLYPVDFVVLNTEPVVNACAQIPVIFGRPFLATINANINVRSGKMSMVFGNMSSNVQVFAHPTH